MEHWRSIVDLPRDGTVIAVLHRTEGAVSAEVLWFGEDDGAGAWYIAGGYGLYEWAENLDPLIIGWLPLPQVAGWPVPPTTLERGRG